uniref:Secreted protein n=1 Tax=Anopheles minimus TaxID=112268 RepID=A0A182W962_9DIPT
MSNCTSCCSWLHCNLSGSTASIFLVLAKPVHLTPLGAMCVGQLHVNHLVFDDRRTEVWFCFGMFVQLTYDLDRCVATERCNLITHQTIAHLPNDGEIVLAVEIDGTDQRLEHVTQHLRHIDVFRHQHVRLFGQQAHPVAGAVFVVALHIYELSDRIGQHR